MRLLDEHNVDVRFDDAVAGPDGCRFSVNLFRPSAGPSTATVVVWTPYGNSRSAPLGPSPVASLGSPRHCRRLAAAAGATVMSVDVRGRGDSDGTFTPFTDEAADAIATVAALAGHPWCNGPVVVMGQGYGAVWALAAARHPMVGGAFLISPPGRAWDVFPGRDGARRSDLLVWRHLLAGRHPLPTGFADWAHVLTAPWAEQEHRLGHNDIGWAAFDGAAAGDPPDIPVTIMTGWWDPACRAAWELAGRCPDAELVVGPWTAYAARHPAQHVGGVDWGPGSVVDPVQLQVELVQRAARTRGRVFVTGANAWRDLPLPVAASWVLRPSSTWGALTTAGDGRLGAAAGAGVDVFTSDLADPVPAQPGMGAAVAAGAPALLDLTFLDGRHDVAVYTSDPLTEPHLVIGEVSVELAAGSDSPAAALWVASLEDVLPGATASLHLALGVAVAEPGQRALALRLGPIGHQFLPGHRVRLRIAATCAPLFRPSDDAPARELRSVHHTGSVLRLPEVLP